MGFRTVVILANDQAHEWNKDPELGKKIFHGMHGDRFPYGSIVECCHADQQTLGIIDSYDFHPMVYEGWVRQETPQERDLKMLKRAAETMGYRLVKKS